MVEDSLIIRARDLAKKLKGSQGNYERNLGARLSELLGLPAGDWSAKVRSTLFRWDWNMFQTKVIGYQAIVDAYRGEPDQFLQAIASSAADDVAEAKEAQSIIKALLDLPMPRVSLQS